MTDRNIPARHRIVALAYEGLWPLEFGIAAEIFGWPRPELEKDWYEFRVACPNRSTQAIGGYAITSPYGIESLYEADTIIIPGWQNIIVPPPQEILDAVQAAHANGTRLLSFCTGAFVFAHAGLT